MPNYSFIVFRLDSFVQTDNLITFLMPISGMTENELLTLLVFSDNSSITVSAQILASSLILNVKPLSNWEGTSEISAIISNGVFADKVYFEFNKETSNDSISNSLSAGFHSKHKSNDKG